MSITQSQLLDDMLIIKLQKFSNACHINDLRILSRVIVLVSSRPERGLPSPLSRVHSHPPHPWVNLSHKISEITCTKSCGYRQMVIVQFSS